MSTFVQERQPVPPKEISEISLLGLSSRRVEGILLGEKIHNKKRLYKSSRPAKIQNT